MPRWTEEPLIRPEKVLVPKALKNFAGRDKVRTYVPPAMMTMYEQLGDLFKMGSPAPTREMLDENEFTKDLPDVEKNDLIEYWSPFQNVKKVMLNTKEERERKTALALKADEKAVVIKEEKNLGALSLPEQLRAVTQLFANQIYEGSVRLVAMDIEDINDEFGLKLMKHRMMYVKEFMYIHEQLMKVANRVDEYNQFGLEGIHLTDQAKEILAQADETLRKHKKDKK